MCYTRRKIEGGDGTLWESDDANFLNPNGQSKIETSISMNLTQTNATNETN